MAAMTNYNFYATAEDIAAVFRMVEVSYHLQYVQCGLFDEPNHPIFHGFSSLPALGVAQTGESIREPIFLVMFEGDRLNIRTVPQRRGGLKYAVDQKINPGTVTIRPAGIYQDSALIAGLLGTVHQDEKATRLMKVFSSALKQSFIKVKSYFVGPQAQKLFISSMRLTHSILAPAGFDLSI